MINCTCIVQAGQSPDQNKEKLQSVLTNFTSTSLGEDAQITWIPVAPGNGFTEAKPSTSSVVSITANRALSATERESLLHALVDLWTSETGCSIDEIVAVIADPTHQAA